MNRIVEKLGPITLFTVQAPCLDAANASDFKSIVKELRDTSPRLIIDLSLVEFLDSSGCGAILTALRWMDQVGGKLALCGLTDRARASLALFQMLRILEVYPTRADAIARG
jgi:anti-anti-sigma factor